MAVVEIMDVFNFIGSIGTGLYVCSYVLLQIGKLSGDSVSYTVMNLCAASLVSISLVFGGWNLPSFMIQSFWIAVSIYGLARKGFTSKTRTSQ